MEKIIWQPSLGYYEFNISLDKDFARDMLLAKIPAKNQDALNQVANRELERLKIGWKNPYSFHEDSCFVKQIYIGSNGVGLSTNHQTINNLLKNGADKVKYYSHNVDYTSQQHALMILFEKWVDYSDVIKKID